MKKEARAEEKAQRQAEKERLKEQKNQEKALAKAEKQQDKNERKNEKEKDKAERRAEKTRLKAQRERDMVSANHLSSHSGHFHNNTNHSVSITKIVHNGVVVKDETVIDGVVQNNY